MMGVGLGRRKERRHNRRIAVWTVAMRKKETSQMPSRQRRAAERHSVALCFRQLMLGNNDVARCDLVWRQPRLKRHLPGRLPDNADDSASLRSYVVQLIPESHWLIADRMDSALLASHSDAPSGSRVHAVDDGNAEIAAFRDVVAT